VRITETAAASDQNDSGGGFSSVWRLDYLSCVLTIISTILVGRRFWEGWVLAGINSVIICVLAIRTAQTGFIPANLFCIVLYGINLRAWRKEGTSS
jgi:nicotinamide riboside transporter PnuC